MLDKLLCGFKEKLFELELRPSTEGYLDLFTFQGFCPVVLPIQHLPKVYSSLVNADLERTVLLQQELIFKFGSILGFDPGPESQILHYGSEANIQAIRFATRSIKRKKIIVSNLAHKSLLSTGLFEPIIIDVDPGNNFQINQDKLEQVIEENIDDIGIVAATYGTTFFGTNELFLNKLLDLPSSQEIKDETWVHVDAAYGWISMLYDSIEVPEFTIGSVIADCYKFIGLPGCSALLVKGEVREDSNELMESYFNTYQSTRGTFRTSWQAYILRDIFKHYGIGKIRERYKQCLEKAKEIVDELSDAGLETIIPITTPIIPFKLNSKQEVHYMVNELRKQGYIVAPIHLSGTDSSKHKYNVYGIRVVISPIKHQHKQLDKFVGILRSSYNVCRA